MGTRHLTAVILKEEPKIAQYGQWDGYPSGQGLNILRILKSIDLDKFKEQVSKCKFLSEEEIKEKWVECGADRNSEWVPIQVADILKDKYPEFSRDTGSEILKMVYDGNSLELQNSYNFSKDSLCEWAYVIDLDKNLLEVYRGFNKPLTENERFYDSEQGDDEYYPVNFKKSYDLNKLPSKKDFLKDLTEEEEE